MSLNCLSQKWGPVQSIQLLLPERLRDQTRNPHAGILEEHAISMEKGRDSCCLHKDGREFPAEISLSSMWDEYEQLVLICFRDISDRKRADMAREQLAAIVKYSDSAIISETLHGIVITWNRGAERLYGYSAAEMVGHSVSIILPQDRKHETASGLQTLGAGGRIPRETIHQAKDGRLIAVLQTVSPIQDAAGHLVAASVIAIEIGEHGRGGIDPGELLKPHLVS
jgi:PAS domain S-box-containing protein